CFLHEQPRRRRPSRYVVARWSRDRCACCQRLFCEPWSSSPSTLGLDAGDLERGERLAMTCLPAVVLPPPELEDDHLRRAVLRDDLRFDLRAADGGLADLHAVTAADEEHLVERERVAHVAGKLFDTKPIALRDPVLLSARSYHCIHGSP